jgi:hypothetical protein
MYKIDYNNDQIYFIENTIMIDCRSKLKNDYTIMNESNICI